jgi:CubicO group peptidase (beta-lactamase class C family)
MGGGPPQASAEAPEPDPQPGFPVQAGIDPIELEAFLDDFVPDQLSELHVPGLVFVLVEDGEVTFARGYGLADRERGIPFDPEQSIIRAGSIVKTITATALMQLAERGQIDLDQDVNQYLTTFHVPDTYPEPITARQLLHYTGGLDSRFVGIRVPDPGELMPLAGYLAERLPPRTRPPGVIRAYNDHEIALAGLVVEEVSRMSYEEYVQANIFEPLEMHSTSLVLPPAQLDRVAIGYSATGPYPLNYYYLNNAPGAGINTTAMDLARYMIMHLQNGRYLDRQILGTDTAEEMHRTGFSHHPALPGIAYTFDEVLWGEYRILAKSGGAPGFQNRMLLFPEQGIGVYFTYNRDSSVPLRGRLEDAFLERFFPASQVGFSGTPLADAAARSQRYVGYYQDMNDYSVTTIERISQLMNQVRVTANEDGTLNLFGGRIVEVEPGLFQWDDSRDYVAFREDDSGEVTHLLVARTAFARLPWYETAPLQTGLLGFALLAFLSGALAWLVAILRGKGRGRHLGGALSLLVLAFLIGFGTLFAPLVTSPDPPWGFSFEPSLALRLVLLLTPAIALLTGLLMVASVRQWLRHEQSPTRRIHNTVMLAAGLGFVFFLHTWNLLGWRF